MFKTMGAAVKLELCCPRNVGNIVVDPQPDWTFDSLLSELSSIEENLKASPVSFTKTQPRTVSSAKCVERKPGAFVMRVGDVEDEDGDDQGRDRDQISVKGKLFKCGEIYVSDSDNSEDESSPGNQLQLMDKTGLVEGELSELIDEYQLCIVDVIRSQILALETNLINENKKLACALTQVEKNTEVRREMEKKLDMQYQRRVAEALDNHLTAVQRDHEHKFQIEEKRIRNDAAIEEAKRREKAMEEEKLRQEKLRVEAEMQAKLVEKKRAEEAQAAALEAERKVAKEAAERAVRELSASTASAMPSTEATLQQVAVNLGAQNGKPKEHVPNGLKQAKAAGTVLKGTESALKLEERRLQILKDIAEKNKALGLGSTRDYPSHFSKIQRVIKQISAAQESIRKRLDELARVFLDSSCPQPISVATFAERMVYQCGVSNQLWFAYAHVAVLVASKVPLAMDLLLAELNRVCIFTVPKFITYSKSVFNTKEAYYKAIGYKEEDGVTESEESFISRTVLCMKFYGALVQTQIEGIENLHGLKEGWAWLARFLNALPANVYTASALHAFLEVAGFALHRKYKSQFKKLLNIISRDFVTALKQREGKNVTLTVAITNIQRYIESNAFLEEPVGRSLQTVLKSNEFAPEPENRDPFYGRWANSYSY